MVQLSYEPCPCGSGKKIKFCCCKDILPNLEKVVRMMEGEQRVAGLEQINRLISSKGPRDALLALKLLLEFGLGQYVQCRETAVKLLEQMLNNATAWIHLAALDAVESVQPSVELERRRVKLRTAVENFHRGIPGAGVMKPLGLDTVLSLLAQALSVHGEIFSARAHLMLVAGLAEEEEKAWEQLLGLMRMPVPAVLKEDVDLEESPPADAPWKQGFDKARELEIRLSWLEAVDQFEKLAQQFPQAPLVLKHLAVLRSWLVRTEESAEAWHRYASLPQLPYEEAVEMEALAQLQDRLSALPRQEVLVSYAVPNADSLMERLLSDRRAVSHPVQPTGDDQPPPKGVFLLLDRPAPDAAALQRESVPRMLGQLQLYGKQTDREAYAEMIAEGGESLENAQRLLQEIGSDQLGAAQTPEVVRHMTLLDTTFRWKWYLPPGVSVQRYRELVKEQAEETLYQEWPQQPLPALDGKRPAEVAGQDQYRVRLAAAILVVEMSYEQEPIDTLLDFNRLRQQLQVAPRETITGVKIKDIPLARFCYVDVQQLAQEDLAVGLFRAVTMAISAAIYHFGRELLRRGSFDEQTPVEEVFNFTLEAAWTPQQTLETIERGRQLADSLKNKDLLQAVLLAELRMRVNERDTPRVQRILAEMHAAGLLPPEAVQELVSRLAQMGMNMTEGAAAAKPQGIWTPGAAASSPTSEKPRIWVPGMD